MIRKLHDNVSVILVYNHKLKKICPKQIQWKDQTFKVIKLGYHLTQKKGRHLIHTFSVLVDNGLYMRLAFHGTYLGWVLVEIADDCFIQNNKETINGLSKTCK